MVVVAHEHVGVHLPAGARTGLRQRVQEVAVVLVIQEDELATDTAGHDVVKSTRVLEAEAAGHGCEPKRRLKSVSNVIG